MFEQHSPAPFSVEACEADHGHSTVILDAENYVLARIDSRAYDDRAGLPWNCRHDRANAHLFAASPKLLKLIERVLAAQDSEHRALKAAIGRASPGWCKEARLAVAEARHTPRHPRRRAA